MKFLKKNKKPIIIGIIAFVIMTVFFIINYNYHCYDFAGLSETPEETFISNQLLEKNTNCPIITKNNWKAYVPFVTKDFFKSFVWFMLFTSVVAVIVFNIFKKFGYKEAIISGISRWVLISFVHEWFLWYIINPISPIFTQKPLLNFFQMSSWYQHMMVFELGIMVGGYLVATLIYNKLKK